MRLLIVGCERDSADLLRRLRLARSLRPLHMCFWDPDIEAGRVLMNSVGAGLCLREVTPALLVHVDVVLMFADDANGLQMVRTALERMRNKPLQPAIVSVELEGQRVHLAYVGSATPEQRIVCRILFKAIDDAVPRLRLAQEARRLYHLA